MRTLKSFCLAMLLLPSLATSALANPYEKTLSNGLKVIVKEDHRAPTVVQMLWYRVGAMDETAGKTGLAHVLEHMMFKGTPNIRAGEFNQRVALAGGRDNAFTNNDYTAYFQQIPKEKLEEMMMLESDRMAALQYKDEDFDSEIKVVMEERRLRTDDNPASKLYESLQATMWQTHPYRNPVIGWMDDLKHLTIDDTRQWHKTWYAPNNATLVIAGDVERNEVFKLAEQYYGAIEKREMPERRAPFESEQTGEKRIVVTGFARQPQLVMAWKVPHLLEKESDSLALELLNVVLDGHNGARFPKRLVQERMLATDVSISYDNINRGTVGVFYISATPAKNVSPLQLESAIWEELARLKDEPITNRELNRARTQYKASEIYKKDSLFAQAMELGVLDNAGVEWKYYKKHLNRLEKVSAEEVQNAVRFLDRQHLSVGVLWPESK